MFVLKCDSSLSSVLQPCWVLLHWRPKECMMIREPDGMWSRCGSLVTRMDTGLLSNAKWILHQWTALNTSACGHSCASHLQVHSALLAAQIMFGGAPKANGVFTRASLQAFEQSHDPSPGNSGTAPPLLPATTEHAAHCGFEKDLEQKLLMHVSMRCKTPELKVSVISERS